MTPVLSIIIVHWNTPEQLDDCLHSIFEYEHNLHFEVIVIDNHSDSKISAVRSRYGGRTKFIELEENVGFGRGCNRGVLEARGEFFLFLGPDVRIIKENTIFNTLDQLKEIPDAGAISCQLLNLDGSPQKHTFNLPRADKLIAEWWYEITNHIPLVYQRRIKQPKSALEKVDMVIAHWLMISKKAFQAAGGFPNEAFMFGDDIELNKEILDAGYSNYVYRNEQAIHIGGQSTRQRYQKRLVIIVQDSITKYCFRHYGLIGGSLSIILIVARAALNLVILTPIYLRKGQKNHVLENWRIIWHYFAYQWRPGRIAELSGAKKK